MKLKFEFFLNFLFVKFAYVNVYKFITINDFLLKYLDNIHKMKYNRYE